MDRYLNITEARKELLDIVEHLHGSDRVVITKRGQPRAVLVNSERYTLLEDVAWVLQDPGRRGAAARMGGATTRSGYSPLAAKTSFRCFVARSGSSESSTKDKGVRRYTLSPQFLRDFQALEPGLSPADEEILNALLVALIRDPQISQRIQSFYDPQRPSWLVRCGPFLVHYAFDPDSDEVTSLNLFRRQ